MGLERRLVQSSAEDDRDVVVLGLVMQVVEQEAILASTRSDETAQKRFNLPGLSLSSDETSNSTLRPPVKTRPCML